MIVSWRYGSAAAYLLAWQRKSLHLADTVAKLGFEAAPKEFTGPLVGLFEFACGFLLLLGLFSRLAVVPLIVIMIVAILTTKVPILLGHDWLIFHVRPLDSYGFWSIVEEPLSLRRA